MSTMAAILDIQSNDFSYFWSSSHLDTSFQVLSQVAFGFRKSSKQIFKMATMAAILEFWSDWF